MKATRVADAKRVDTPHGVDVRKLYDTEHAQTMHITLKPGESLKRHITPVDVFFYVLEGEGLVEIGDEEKSVTRDTIIDSPAKIPHCWYNRSDSDFRVLVVKVPRPQNVAKLL
ncbi:cupin domain-containing protein [Chitinispirillales bacterium ANBcel5]|uniref:cupin domain-containing protein n=1 Tax=Cellulosispirillum alkaliphilum TaxID=3039283 RepID=UPI002A562E57|nr:cupin domain-containing protein [Chitinispirillales bacterium ANBcel5]